MDFDKLIEYLNKLSDSAKPVGGLISDFYQSLILNIPEFEILTSVGKWVLIIVGIVFLFYRAVGD